MESRSVSDERIDWSQLWYPGPRRDFSAEELVRAGSDRPSRTLLVVTAVNAALVGFALLVIAPQQVTARALALMLAACVFAAIAARAVWRRPSRRALFRWTLAYSAGAGVFAVFIMQRTADRLEREWSFGICWGAALVVSIGLWALTVYRADLIAARLSELDERERRADMARQLAQAQIQPHFLFNSLASLQQWVQAKDDRAAPLLAALCGFLRATLPLFDRRVLRVHEEVEAVRQYLTVMQLRLGERLRWTTDVEPAAAGAVLPPGLLLTLVENAIEHGIQPILAGGELHVRAAEERGRLVVEVRDSGPGLAPGATEGVGLTNARARLAQAFGADAGLTLSNAEGCLARIECPWTQKDPT